MSPSSGTNAGTVTVTPSISGLDAGTYTTDITVAAAGATGSPKTVPVTLHRRPAGAAGAVGDAGDARVHGDAAARTRRPRRWRSEHGLRSAGWTASEDAAWLSVSPASGTNAGTVTVTPSITGLAAGTYTATVPHGDPPGATGSPKTVTVTLTGRRPVQPRRRMGLRRHRATTTADGSGSGNTGTLNGPAQRPAGRFGGALSFDGVNDWVTVADANSLDLTTGMTLEAWVRPTAVGSAWRTVMLKEQPSNLIYALYAGNGNGRAASTFSPPLTSASAGPPPPR